MSFAIPSSTMADKKKIKANDAATAGNNKRRKSPDSVTAAIEIIILDSDDDDEDEGSNKPAAKVTTTTMLPDSKRQKTDETAAAAAAAVLVSSVAVDIGAKNLFSSVANLNNNNENDDDDDDDADVMIVEPPKQDICPVAARAPNHGNGNAKNDIDDDDDDDIELVGCANQCHLPHLRQHCTEKPFVPLTVFLTDSKLMPGSVISNINKDNVETCDLCYCYVCDMPVKDCKRWSSSVNTSLAHNHCHASEKGPNAHRFTKLRELCKTHNGSWTLIEADFQKSITPATSSSSSSFYSVSSSAMQRMDDRMEAAFQRRFATNMARYGLPTPTTTATSTLAAAGSSFPWAFTTSSNRDRTTTATTTTKTTSKHSANKQPPATEVPAELKKGAYSKSDPKIAKYRHLLTPCRKCEYYSYTGDDRRDPTKVYLVEGSSTEWCQACGRVAPANFMIQKNQSVRYVPKPTDVLLGSKTIPFTIKAHDPRTMQLFKENWTKHKKQKKPVWKYNAAEMEHDVFHHRIGAYPTLEMLLKSIPILRRDLIPQDGVQRHEENATTLTQSLLDDTDAINMDRNSSILLQELFAFSSVGYFKDRQNKNCMVQGDILATWNTAQRRGQLVVRIFFNPNGNTTTNMTRFLGAWFGFTSFPLSSLAGRMTATTTAVNPCISHPDIFPAPPFRLDGPTLEKTMEGIRGQMETAIGSFNNAIVKSAAEKLSLQSSVGNTSLLGGFCYTDHSFSGMLQRYYTEMLPEDVENMIFSKRSATWAGRALGITSHHRSMRTSKERIFGHREAILGHRGVDPDVSVESYVRDSDLALCENIREDCKKIFDQTRSLQGILMHLENLGHGDSPFVEGLNMELLPFQRQSLQWALERETTPGGVQSYLWARLPLVQDPKSPNVYFNPILQRVTTTKPKLIRGGIIADEMGLGKTVVSLGLILQNPAPLLPESGSSSNLLKPEAFDGKGWDPAITTGTTSGSVLSRGTLVICHISLVGQWIEEAKSKLKDPGLVYAYHGSSRKRDPMILAKNSIVVTTYATLASDKFYPGYQKGIDNYCPPCEQVRWWRIICDESHALKSVSKQRQTVLNLIADHKWAVSGTPWNMSLLDVKGQLQFVGIENLEEMFQEFSSTVFGHVGDKQAKRHAGTSQRKFGHFMFLMRAVMIRHSQKQQYSGTSTTLMSLPPKSERTMEIDFIGSDTEEYAKLEKDAIDFYLPFRAEHPDTLSSHYLKLLQKLTPMRIACAGGRIPLGDDDEGEEGDAPKADVGNSTKKKEKKFSEFAFYSKCTALIDELKRVRDEDSSSKSLVFSQYASSLKFLQEELPKHGFQFRTLAGNMTLKNRAEALYKFQKDPPTTIFLLSMRAGAMGINLTQANRVFMLEPAMNPALEAQAVGRVYRLGQTRPVEIVRLLMKGSIETRMRSFLEKKYGVAQKPSATDESKGEAPAPAPDALVSNAIVGSLRTDKAALMAEEFDILFGVDADTPNHEYDPSENFPTMAFVPDPVGSRSGHI